MNSKLLLEIQIPNVTDQTEAEELRLAACSTGLEGRYDLHIGTHVLTLWADERDIENAAITPIPGVYAIAARNVEAAARQRGNKRISRAELITDNPELHAACERALDAQALRGVLKVTLQTNPVPIPNRRPVTDEELQRLRPV